MSTVIQVAIATGFHLFPFRTEKLSPSAPMVLRKWESRSPPSLKALQEQNLRRFLFVAQYQPYFSSAYAERGKWESRSPPFFRTLWTNKSGASFFFY